MEAFFSTTKSPKLTTSCKSIIGCKVITLSGAIYGTVTDIAINNGVLQGVYIRRFPNKKRYVGIEYVEKLTPVSCMLNFNPVDLHYGKKVRSSDGKEVGVLVSANRKHDTHEIDSIIIRRFLVKKHTIRYEEVKNIGSAVILKRTYDEAKKLFR